MNREQMRTDYLARLSIAASVAKECNASAHGVVIKVEYQGNNLSDYVVWTTKRGRGLVSMHLSCESTSAIRLAAHVNGFIENTQGD
jgi:hypothetical protein